MNIIQGLCDKCNDFLFALNFGRDFMMPAFCPAYAVED